MKTIVVLFSLISIIYCVPPFPKITATTTATSITATITFTNTVSGFTSKNLQIFDASNRRVNITPTINQISGRQYTGTFGGLSGNTQYTVRYVNLPASVCSSAISLNTNPSDSVIGNGTPESCSNAASQLQTYADKGGKISFNCGPDPFLIEITTPIKIPTCAEAGKGCVGNLTIDGGGLVILNGKGRNRIIEFGTVCCDGKGVSFPYPVLTIQNLFFTGGYHKDPKNQFSAGSGGSIYKIGGVLNVINTVFWNNNVDNNHPETGGAAIWSSFGPTEITNSIMISNRGAQGAAIKCFASDPCDIFNTIMSGNTAYGGGGAVAYDNYGLMHLCGCVLNRNEKTSKGGQGGGVYRVGYNHQDPYDHTIIEKSLFEENYCTPQNVGDSPTLYLQDHQVTVHDSTFALSRCESGTLRIGWYNIKVNVSGGMDLQGITLYKNTIHASYGLGAGMSIAPPSSLASGAVYRIRQSGFYLNTGTGFGESIFGLDNNAVNLTVDNTAFASYRTGEYNPHNCANGKAVDGPTGNNYQWPKEGVNCTSSINFVPVGFNVTLMSSYLNYGDHGCVVPTVKPDPASGFPSSVGTQCSPPAAIKVTDYVKDTVLNLPVIGPTTTVKCTTGATCVSSPNLIQPDSGAQNKLNIALVLTIILCGFILL